MQIVLDFVTGKVDCETFKQAWYANPEIGQWLEQLVDLKSPLPPEWKNAPYSLYREVIHERYNGSALAFINVSENDPNAGKYPKWVDIGWHFDIIAAVVVVAYPDIVPTTFYEEEQNFYMNAVGDYIGGVEVEEIIDETIHRFPATLGKTKRKKEAKAAIKELFHMRVPDFPDGRRNLSGQWVKIHLWHLFHKSVPETWCSLHSAMWTQRKSRLLSSYTK